MNIKSKSHGQLKKRLRYLQATNRGKSPEAMHIKGQINIRYARGMM